MVARALDRARELHHQGWTAATADHYPSAIRSLRRGLVVLDDAAGTDAELVEVRIRLLSTLAFCMGETSGLDAAVALFDAARQEVAKVPDPDVQERLNALIDHNHGAQITRMGLLEQAAELLSSYVRYVERHLEDGVEPFVVALTNRGLLYAALRRRDEASADLDRAVALAERHDLPMRAAIAVHSLGNLHKQCGDLTEALRRYEEADRAFRKLEPGLLVRLRLDQAEAMLVIGLSDEAGKQLDEALPEMRKERIGQDLAEVEMFRASAALLDGELELARRMAGASYRKLVRRGSPWAMMAALIQLVADGRLALRRKRITDAMVSRAVRLSDELAASHLVDESRLARLLATRLEVRRGHLDAAETLLRQIPGPRAVTPIDHRMQRRLCLAELAVAKGNLRSALTHARLGLEELGRVRDRMGGLELVSATAAHGRELGELAIRLVLAGGDSPVNAARLFDWLERTRAQTYRYEPLDPAEHPEIVDRIAEVRDLRKKLLGAELSRAPTTELRARLMTAQREATQLGWHLHRWGRPRPVADVAGVSAGLGDRALVNFVASDDEMIAVVLTGVGTRMVRLGAARQAFESARRLHVDLNALAPDHLPAALAEVIGASARRQADLLDEQLLRPLADLIGDRDVVVVPTGALYAVPWGVLPTFRGRPTVAAPSATAWLAATRADRPTSDRVLLVRGPGLEAAEGEIDKLAGYHHEATILAAEQATAAAVLDLLDGIDLAHIAAHGEHEPENALFSRLELVDGALFAHELGRLRRPPTQVVLAACELALNRIRPGDEALGFAGALLAGGTRTVIAASSKVGDEPSAAAMGDYHRALAMGAAPAVALAEAIAVDPFRRPFLCLGSG